MKLGTYSRTDMRLLLLHDLSVCVSVCLSIVHVCKPCRNGWMDWDAVL